MPQVALSKDFLEAYSRLPRGTQKKVREFTEKFTRDPTQATINYERIKEAQDHKVRSVRIDQAYRAIVVHPPKGDVYLCVWVDHHDDAYRWVRNKHFEVNPNSGILQLFDVSVSVPPGSADSAFPVPASPPSTPPTGRRGNKALGRAPQADDRALFSSVDDEDLLLAGVPGVLLPSVRALASEVELDRLSTHLPEDCSDVLYSLAAGYSLVDALEEVERSKERPGQVDTQDFAAALETPQSQRQFRIVDDSHDLNQILDAPLEQWRIFLHPTQRRLVRMNAKGPVKVLGGAGTGKTVVLMHRARYLAKNVFTAPDDRILVTTYTRNLAHDLEVNLRNLCGKEEFQRIEIVNLHRWAQRFLQGHGVKLEMTDGRDCDDAWEAALTEAAQVQHPASFFKDEWERVVQAHNVEGLDDYLLAPRTGRGTSLSRHQRAAAWKVMQRYVELLEARGLTEWPALARETRLYIEKQRVVLPYRAVLADEVQDFSANDLRLLRALVPKGPNDLFIAGDGHQRIYGFHTPLSRLGIETRGRSRRLKLNYRTTQAIRKYAVALLRGCTVDDLDEGRDTLKGFWSLRNGPPPVAKHFRKESDEATFIVENIRKWLKEGVAPESICLAARRNSMLNDRYERILAAAQIKASRIGPDEQSGDRNKGVRLATMHRLKGLEFMRVVIAGVQEGIVPWQPKNYEPADDTARAHHETMERCLLYVAVTRARDQLVISGFGQPSPFLKAIKS